MTLYDCNYMHRTYGTLFVIDGDAAAVVVYDDDEDAERNWPVTILDMNGDMQ